MTDYSPQFPSIEKSLNGSMMGDMSKRLVEHNLRLGHGDKYIFPWAKGTLNIWLTDDSDRGVNFGGAIFHFRWSATDAEYSSGWLLEYLPDSNFFQPTYSTSYYGYTHIAFDIVEFTFTIWPGAPSAILTNIHLYLIIQIGKK